MSIEIEVYSEFGVPFRMENNLVVWEPEEGQSIPDQNLVDQKIAEYNANQYQRDRAEQYPSIQDVVVALAEKQEGDDTMWQEITAKRAKVKSENPKPT